MYGALHLGIYAPIYVPIVAPRCCACTLYVASSQLDVYQKELISVKEERDDAMSKFNDLNDNVSGGVRPVELWNRVCE